MRWTSFCPHVPAVGMSKLSGKVSKVEKRQCFKYFFMNLKKKNIEKNVYFWNNRSESML